MQYYDVIINKNDMSLAIISNHNTDIPFVMTIISVANLRRRSLALESLVEF